jgi:copper transport protein
VFAVAILAVLFAVLPQTAVSAHANQVRSTPAPDSQLDEPPDRVIVWFSEPIEPGLSDVRVLDAFARQVDNADSALSPTEPTALVVTLPPLENGTYTVVWRNVSTVDGHRVIGSFRFAVGEPLSEAVGAPLGEQSLVQSAADPWLRWVFLIGALAMTGVLGFDLLVLRTIIGASERRVISDELILSLQRIMFRVMLTATALMVFGLLALLVQQASVTFEKPVFGVVGEPLRSVLDSDWGRQWTWRMVAVVGTVALAVVSARSVLRAVPAADHELDDGEDTGGPVAYTETMPGALALASGLAVLFLTSFSSHSAAVPSDVRTPAVVTDFLHLLAASLWVGGLFFLAFAVAIVVRSVAPPVRGQALKAVLSRFSAVAIASAGTLIVTGIFAGYMQVTVPSATVTPYGWALVSKLALLVPLLGFATVNSYLVSRRLLRSNGAARAVKNLVWWEAGVAVLVIAATGWLAGLEPARQYAARAGTGMADELTFSDFVEGAEIDLSISPGRFGPNRVIVELKDRRGEAITNATDVRVRLKFLEQDLGEPLASLTDAGSGRWVSDNYDVAVGGVYQAEVVVIRPDAFDARTSFRFDASPPGAAGDDVRPARSVAWTLFGVELLLVGGFMVLAGAPVLRSLRAPSRLIALPGAVACAAGLVFLLNAQVFRVGFPEDRFNPFPISSESIETGHVAYLNTCASCHGESGHGDGPLASGLSSPPADLGVHVPLHADGDLFGFIRDGIPGTSMPGQAGNLSEDEMWHLVNFLRTFEE